VCWRREYGCVGFSRCPSDTRTVDSGHADRQTVATGQQLSASTSSSLIVLDLQSSYQRLNSNPSHYQLPHPFNHALPHRWTPSLPYCAGMYESIPHASRPDHHSLHRPVITLHRFGPLRLIGFRFQFNQSINQFISLLELDHQ